MLPASNSMAHYMYRFKLVLLSFRSNDHPITDISTFLVIMVYYTSLFHSIMEIRIFHLTHSIGIVLFIIAYIFAIIEKNKKRIEKNVTTLLFVLDIR